MRAKFTLSLTLLLLAAAGPAAAAPGSSVKIRSVSVPRSATAGTTVNVTVKFSGKRHAHRPKLTLYLSSDAKRDGRDVRLKTGVGQASIPEDQALGDYRVIACAGKSCAASKKTLTVTKTPVGTAQLVDQAIAAGKLSPEQGLVYRAFAAFGDRRLPAAYAGDDTAHEDTVMREVAESWPKLSTAQRRQVEPFFTPPAAKGGAASASAGSTPGAQPACPTSRYARRGWRSVAEKDGHVRVWWYSANQARFAKRARAMLAEADDSWRKLWPVFGRDPVSDEGERCFHGGDGKLDIYLLNRLKGDTKGEAIPYPGSCSHAAPYIVFYAGAEQPTRWELAHELTHAFQFAFPLMSCSSFANLDEAVATWGGQYVYPRDDREHEFKWFMKEPLTPLKDASYDGWVFPYALEQLVGPGVMQRIYEQGASHTAMASIEAGVPGGLAKVYPEFAKLAWNHDPVKPSFWEWDGFDPVPEDTGGEIVPEQVSLGAAGQSEVDLTLPQMPLSRAYKHLKFGPDVRDVIVQTPYDADLHAEALLKLRDGTSTTVDLAKRRGAVFCPQAASQQVAEMVLVVSDTSTYRQMPQDKPIRVLANNFGCARYAGSGSGVEHVHGSGHNTTEKWTVTNLVYKREFSGEDDPTLHYALTGGTVQWSYSGTYYDCTVSAGPVTFQLPPADKSGGQMQITPFLGQKTGRRYFLSTPDLPVVQGTEVCPYGTYVWNVKPHKILETWNWPTRDFDVPGNGIIDGTNSGDEASGGYRDVEFHWHLEPQ